MKKLLDIFGVVLILMGAFFILHGANILRVFDWGHNLRYIVIGTGLAVFGIAVIVFARRSIKSKPPTLITKSTLKHRYSPGLKQTEWVFVIIALLSGIVMCFFIPAQSGFDEITHLARIWEISGGYLIPNQRFSQGPYLPTSFLDISYRNQYFFDPVLPDYFTVYGNERIDSISFLEYHTRSSYLPTVYLPQAFVVGLLGRIFNAPVLVIFYTCRLLYLLGYILLTTFAIRLIPFGKWLLVVLALAPIAMFQSSSISPDAYTFGVSFLFVGWILKLAFQEKRINWRQFWITMGVTTLLLMVKLNAAFLLPLLLLLVWKGFESKKMLPALVGMTVILFAGFFIGWNVISYYSSPAQPGYGAMGQLTNILSHPLEFGSTIVHDIALHGISYLRDWVATYGFGDWQVLPITYPLFGLTLVAAWLFSPSPMALNTRSRLLLIITGVLGCFLMTFVIYLTINPIGSSKISLIQGRYFTPIVPIIFLGLVPGRKLFFRLAGWVVPVIVAVGAVLTLAFYILGGYFSFYVVCGTSLYTPGLCYQPKYKNWAPNDHFTQPIAQNLLLQQTFTAVCAPLKSVRVWSAPATLGLTGETQITLKDDGSGAVLMENLVNNQIVANHGWLEMTFAPVNNAVGKKYRIEITSDLSDPTAGLSFGVTARREYLNGLVINNVPANFDLIFQYGCEPLTLKNAIFQKIP